MVTEAIQVREENEKTNPIQDIISTCKLLISPRMLMVLPIITWSTISLSILASVIYTLIIRTM